MPPIKTGFQGFAYDIRTAVLPLLFIFNTDLLLIDVGFWGGVLVFCTALAAMMLFASATQGWFFTRNKWWDTAAFLLIAFTLFRPGFGLGIAIPPYRTLPATEIVEVAEKAPADAMLRLRVSGENRSTGKIMTTTVELPLGSPATTGTERLEQKDDKVLNRYNCFRRSRGSGGLEF